MFDFLENSCNLPHVPSLSVSFVEGCEVLDLNFFPIFTFHVFLS